VSDSLARARLARAAAHFGQPALPSLVLVTDDERLPDPLAAANALPRGSMVLVRAQGAKRRADLSRAMLKLARRKGLAILIADDPELAVKLGADGLHLPEARMREAAQWRARFPALMITAAAHSFRAILQARLMPVDAVFLSPVFATQSHPGRVSLTALRANALARAAGKPVYALGGIDVNNAALLSREAFSGIAAIGALRV
jgi:thiamine-phosphate pyrophosphorylase